MPSPGRSGAQDSKIQASTTREIPWTRVAGAAAEDTKKAGSLFHQRLPATVIFEQWAGFAGHERIGDDVHRHQCQWLRQNGRSTDGAEGAVYNATVKRDGTHSHNARSIGRSTYSCICVVDNEQLCATLYIKDPSGYLVA